MRDRSGSIIIAILGLLCSFSLVDHAYAVSWSSFSATDLALTQSDLGSADSAGGGSSALGGEDPIQGVYFLEPSNMGAASASIPIEVPPGRGGIAPRLALTYSSNRGNGIVGVGWGIGLGEIARATKRGINYGGKEFVFTGNGGSTELVERLDRPAGNYGEAIERSFSKYFLDPSTGGWVVTTKDGTKYYYGSTSASGQENQYGVFKWCLDKIEDTKGNYLWAAYWKDVANNNNEIYPDTIYYTYCANDQFMIPRI